MTQEAYLHSELTDSILKAYYKVYNTLGYGFLEKVYENALRLELKKQGFKVLQQQSITVFYEAEDVGEYFADLVVNDTIILELKAEEHLAHEHECQLINYLKATAMEVGLLLNFGVKPQHKRKVFTND
jgi:GxxExxY protein